MLSNFAVAALAAVGAVNAGPLNRRQATSAVASVASDATAAASSAVSSAASAVSSAASSAASDASSAVSAASSTVASEASSAASSAAPSASSTDAATAGNETFALYPCPAGFLLTYASVNQTLQVPVTEVTAAAGEWASSPFFPNVTMPMGGNEPGATHTINVGELALPEVLVSVETNETSGSAIWNWNGSLPEPVTAMGVSLSNYSTVIQIYDPDFTTTGEIGNTTFVNIFTNACANPQAEAISLLTTLGGLELSNLAAALSGNSTEGGAASTSMMMSESMTESMSMTESAASAASSVASAATESVASAASSAASGASSVASAAASGAASVTSLIVSAASTAA